MRKLKALDRQTKISLTLISAAFVTLIFAISCQREISVSKQDEKIEKAKNWFQSYITGFQPHVMFQNVAYRWDLAKINKAKNGYETIAVPIQANDPDLQYVGQRTLMIYPWKNGRGYYTSVFEFMLDPDYRRQSKNYFKFSQYAGLINIWDLKTGFRRGAYFKQGKMSAIVDLQIKSPTVVNTASRSLDNPVLPVQPSQIYTPLPGVTVYAYRHSSSSAWMYDINLLLNTQALNLSYLVQEAFTQETTNNPCEYSGCTGGESLEGYFDDSFWSNFWNSFWTSNFNSPIDFFHNSLNSTELQKIDFWKFYNVDTSGLDSCRKLIVKRLIDSLGSSPIGVLLANMDHAIGLPTTIDKFKINISMIPASAMQNNESQTVHQFYDAATGDYEADIMLDSAMAKDATELYVATSIIHETIHAYLSYIWLKANFGKTISDLNSVPYANIFNYYIDTLKHLDSLHMDIAMLYGESFQHNYVADELLSYMADLLKQFDGNAATNDRYYWYMSWLGLTRTQVKTWKLHWPNFPTWPPTNPSPSEDSTRGLKYALTLTRIDSMYNIVLDKERNSLSGALGRKPVPGGCY